MPFCSRVLPIELHGVCSCKLYEIWDKCNEQILSQLNSWSSSSPFFNLGDGHIIPKTMRNNEKPLVFDASFFGKPTPHLLPEGSGLGFGSFRPRKKLSLFVSNEKTYFFREFPSLISPNITKTWPTKPICCWNHQRCNTFWTFGPATRHFRRVYCTRTLQFRVRTSLSILSKILRPEKSRNLQYWIKFSQIQHCFRSM